MERHLLDGMCLCLFYFEFLVITFRLNYGIMITLPLKRYVDDEPKSKTHIGMS